MPTNTVYQYFPEINPSNSTLALWYPFTIQLKRGPPHPLPWPSVILPLPPMNINGPNLSAVFHINLH